MCEEERLVKTQDKKTWELWVPDRTDRSELTGNYRRLSNIPKHSTEASTLRGLWVWCLRSEKTWADENFETEGDGNLEKIMTEASTLRGLWVWCLRSEKTWSDENFQTEGDGNLEKTLSLMSESEKTWSDENFETEGDGNLEKTLSLMSESEKTWADENFETEGDGNLEKIMMEASTLRGLWVWCVGRGKTWEDVREEDMRTLSSWPNWPIQTNRKDERCEKMRTLSLKKMETQRRSWWRLWP